MEIDIRTAKQEPHHIIPTSLGGPDPYNTMMLCGPRAAWGCHREAQEGRIPVIDLANRHAALFPEIRDGAHLLEEIRARMMHVRHGTT